MARQPPPQPGLHERWNGGQRIGDIVDKDLDVDRIDREQFYGSSIRLECAQRHKLNATEMRNAVPLYGRTW